MFRQMALDEIRKGLRKKIAETPGVDVDLEGLKKKILDSDLPGYGAMLGISVDDLIDILKDELKKAGRI